MRLKDKVSIITGAASGIGKATAQLFSREGACVVVADWDRENGRKVVKRIEEKEGKALFIHTDVSNPDDVQQMVKLSVDKFGKIDILVNNAGYMAPGLPLVDISEEQWHETIDITLTGTFLCSKYAIPEMKKTGAGVIVNVSSVGGIVAFADNPAYLAAKGGVNQLTKGIAVDYADAGIRANAICPGTIYTEGTAWALEDPKVAARIEQYTLMGRQGSADEIADAILFLASDESSFMTGSIVVVDGGWTVR